MIIIRFWIVYLINSTLWYSLWLHFTVHCYTHTCPQSCLHCRCFIAAFNRSHSPSSGIPNCPRPQLPASNSNNWRLNPISTLADCNSNSKSESKLGYDWQSVSQSVLVSSCIWARRQHFLLSGSCVSCHMVHPLWWEDRSVVYNCNLHQYNYIYHGQSQ
jgi:hypothetical protein